MIPGVIDANASVAGCARAMFCGLNAMSKGEKQSIAVRLADMLTELNKGKGCTVKQLVARFGCTERTVQRDLDAFKFLDIRKDADGFYRLPPTALGKLSTQDIEHFATLAGVRGLFPKLNDEYLRELFDNRKRSAILVQGVHYEDLGGKAYFFDQLESAIVQRQRVSFTYDKGGSPHSYSQVEPYKLVNHDGLWYLAAEDAGKLKAFSLFKMDRLQVDATAYTPNEEVEQTLKDEDDIWLNMKKQEVLLHISGDAMGFFLRRKLVAKQKLLEQHADHIVVSTTIAHPNQVLPIVRQWLPCIRILSPLNLQQALEAGLRQYLGDKS
jgi:predicted DNA-binding transcriptional regulator YafY